MTIAATQEQYVKPLSLLPHLLRSKPCQNERISTYPSYPTESKHTFNFPALSFTRHNMNRCKSQDQGSFSSCSNSLVTTTSIKLDKSPSLLNLSVSSENNTIDKRDPINRSVHRVGNTKRKTTNLNHKTRKHLSKHTESQNLSRLNSGENITDNSEILADVDSNTNPDNSNQYTGRKLRTSSATYALLSDVTQMLQILVNKQHSKFKKNRRYWVRQADLRNNANLTDFNVNNDYDSKNAECVFNKSETETNISKNNEIHLFLPSISQNVSESENLDLRNHQNNCIVKHTNTKMSTSFVKNGSININKLLPSNRKSLNHERQPCDPLTSDYEFGTNTTIDEEHFSEPIETVHVLDRLDDVFTLVSRQNHDVNGEYKG